MEEKFTVANAAIKNGIIVGLISIVITTINNMMGWYENQAIGWAVSILSIAITAYFMVSSHNLYKANNNGFMSYGQGLGIGTLLSLVSSVISGIFNFVYLSFVDEGMLEFQRQAGIEAMQERGMSQGEIDQAMEFAGMFQTPGAIMIFAILFGTLFGFIIALIVSAITKKNDPSLEL